MINIAGVEVFPSVRRPIQRSVGLLQPRERCPLWWGSPNTLLSTLEWPGSRAGLGAGLGATTVSPRAFFRQEKKSNKCTGQFSGDNHPHYDTEQYTEQC